MRFFESAMQNIRDINRKYAKPEIEMTPFVKICLFGLRVYLFLLIGLMIYKFVGAAHASGPKAAERTPITTTQPATMQSVNAR